MGSEMTDITAENADFVFTDSARAAKQSKLRRRLLIGLGAGVVLSAIAYGGYDVLVASPYVTTDNAYVGADVAQINSQVSGPIARVAVRETQMVHKGDVLVEVDSTDTQLAVAQAEANYRSTLQRVSQYYAQRAAAAATVDARLSDVARTSDDYARDQRLDAAGAISKQQVFYRPHRRRRCPRPIWWRRARRLRPRTR